MHVHKILRWWMAASVVSLFAVGMCVVLWPKPDPRKRVLGEWREQSSRMRVEVLPGRAHWRGMGRGTLSYEWLQAREEPYRVRLMFRGQSVEAQLIFCGDDRVIIEPDIWEKLPATAQELLSDINRRHGRPEREFRLLLRRIVTP